MGWSSSQTRPGGGEGGGIGRLWYRLVNMENDRLTKYVLCEINLFVNVTGAMKLNSYFQIMDLRILYDNFPCKCKMNA